MRRRSPRAGNLVLATFLLVFALGLTVWARWAGIVPASDVWLFYGVFIALWALGVAAVGTPLGPLVWQRLSQTDLMQKQKLRNLACDRAQLAKDIQAAEEGLREACEDLREKEDKLLALDRSIWLFRRAGILEGGHR